LRDIRDLAANPSDINEHLELMFVDAILSRPALIVELGVRAGTSTFVFERVAAMCGSDVVSVDLDDCSRPTNIRCHFHKGDDVQFADQFQDFCARRNIVPAIDLLFIDTSHYYDHTVQEIKAWFPLLSSRAKVMFHDTNSRVVGHRADGCFELAWDNQRGVIRAIEEFLGVAIEESRESIQYSKGWMVRHWPNCNGFTILDRLGC
jgi:cephalosporin hydroxylase